MGKCGLYVNGSEDCTKGLILIHSAVLNLSEDGGLTKSEQEMVSKYTCTCHRRGLASKKWPGISSFLPPTSTLAPLLFASST